MFGMRQARRDQLETLRLLNRILEITMATQAQVDALTAAVNQIGTSVSGVASRFQSLADKLAAIPADDDGTQLDALTTQLRTEATNLDAIGQSASAATVEAPPTVTTAEPAPDATATPAPVDTPPASE